MPQALIAILPALITAGTTVGMGLAGVGQPSTRAPVITPPVSNPAATQEAIDRQRAQASGANADWYKSLFGGASLTDVATKGATTTAGSFMPPGNPLAPSGGTGNPVQDMIMKALTQGGGAPGPTGVPPSLTGDTFSGFAQ